MNRRTIIITIAAVMALALAPAAQAHITLQPDEAPAGGFTRLDVRVPNEEDSKDTTKVVVSMPPGFAFASYEPVPGWEAKLSKRKAATPIKSHGDTITEEFSKATFTARAGKGIAPGQFQDFGLSVGVPEGKVASKLTFKALQYYEGGEIVRWIGGPDADKPAPQVTLLAAEEEHEASAAATEPAAAATADGDDEDEDGNGLAIVALVVGGLGLLLGGAALATRKR